MARPKHAKLLHEDGAPTSSAEIEKNPCWSGTLYQEVPMYIGRYLGTDVHAKYTGTYLLVYVLWSLHLFHSALASSTKTKRKEKGRKKKTHHGQIRPCYPGFSIPWGRVHERGPLRESCFHEIRSRLVICTCSRTPANIRSR